MTTQDTPHTPESWSAASAGYAEKVAPILMRPFVDEMIGRLDVASTHDVLEVAAGSGALTEALAPHVRSVLATDFAPKMIEVLERRMSSLGIVNVSYAVMDGQALDLEDDTFDRAASSFGIMLFPDRAKGFAELRRVTRSGGRVVVSGWAGPERFEAFALFLAAVQRAFPDMPPPPAPPPVFSLADPARFATELEEAGFREVEVDFVERDMEVDGVEESWQMFTVGAPPVQALLDRLGPGADIRLRDAHAAIVEDRYGSGPIRLTNTATVASAVVP